MPAIKKLLFVFIVGIVFSACKKEGAPQGTEYQISINDKIWAVEKKAITARYFPQFHQLFIQVKDPDHTLVLGVNLDANQPLTTYKLEPHGDNAASMVIVNIPGDLISDNNVSDAGGSFSLNAFDSVQKRLSCNFQFNCYNSERTKKTISATLNALPYEIDSLADNGNIMRCTVSGANTTIWQSKEWFSMVNCGNTRLELEFRSVAGSRALDFYIPLSIGTGTYQIFPETPPYNYCSSNKITAKYVVDGNYNVTSGSITITKFDVAQRKLEANFIMNLKDDIRSEQIQVTNGTIKLNTWKDKP